MSTDSSDETTARLKHLGGVEILVLVLALGTGGLAAAYAIAMAVGAHAAGLEPPLMLLELGGILALGEGGALVVGVVLFGLAGLRYWDNGFRLDARVVAMPLAIAVIVWSVKYAHEAREAGAARHAREMAEAAEQGGKQRLREIAFACHGFCGYTEDSGPLVWLVGQADSVADYNAIGLMLNQRADRSARSGRMSDPRSALEVAVDRYDTQPDLVAYLLGISRVNHHFMVTRASVAEFDATLLYAVKRRAGAPLVSLLVGNGANPNADVDGGATALEASAWYPDGEVAQAVRRALNGGNGSR